MGHKSEIRIKKIWVICGIQIISRLSLHAHLSKVWGKQVGCFFSFFKFPWEWCPLFSRCPVWPNEMIFLRNLSSSLTPIKCWFHSYQRKSKLGQCIDIDNIDVIMFTFCGLQTCICNGKYLRHWSDIFECGFLCGYQSSCKTLRG